MKLLFAVVSRIAEISEASAFRFIHGWRLQTNVVYVRLWAAAAKLFPFVSASDVASFLIGLDDHQFWDVGAFPEIAELRAVRFGGLDEFARNLIADGL